MLEKERKIAGLKKKKILRLSTRTMRRGREERKDRLAKNVNFFFRVHSFSRRGGS